MNRVQMVGLVLTLIVGVAQTPPAIGQEPGAPPTPNIPALPSGGVGSAGNGQPGSIGTTPDRRVRALTEGPLHEAFLSPRKDKEPNRVEKAPPAPVDEKPAVDPPNDKAQWIEGYWEWDAGRNEYLWVTGTWRVAPPGRFWVNGYWKRDDRGWYPRPGILERSARPTASTIARTARPRSGPTTIRVNRPATIVSTSPASTIPMAMASSGRRASGPRSRPDGPGSPPSGFASPTAGSSRTVTGTGRSKTAGPSSRPPRSTSRRSHPIT